MNLAEAIHPLTVSVCEDWGRLPVTPQHWNALVSRSGTRTIFQTFEWNDAWLAAYGSRWQPLTMCVHDGHELIAIAPFVIEKAANGRLHVALQGHGNADYQDFIGSIEHPGTVSLLLREVASRAPGAIIDLSHVPAASVTTQALQPAARAAGLWALRCAEADCPTLLLRDHRDHAQKLVNKYSLRRPLNYFSRQGKVVARRLDKPEDALAQLPGFFDQHVRRWQQTSTPSPFHDADSQKFFLEMAVRLIPAGWLDFTVVSVDSRPLAYHFGFIYAGALTWYKPSFEIGAAQHSPGLMMIRHLIARALDEGLDEVDFTIGTEQFKARYTNHTRSNISWRLFPSRHEFEAGRLVRAARRFGGRFVRGPLCG